MTSKTRRGFVVAVLATVLVGVGMLLFEAGGSSKRAYPQSAQEWESEGFAPFIEGMSILYGKFDSGRAYDTMTKIEINEIDDSHLSAGEADGYGEAVGIFESLGYGVERRGDGLFARNDSRGYEVLIRPAGTTVNETASDLGAVFTEDGRVLVDIDKLSDALGYERATTLDGNVALTDPYQTARVIVRGKEGAKASDGKALATVSGPDGITVLQYRNVREAREAQARLRDSNAVTWAGPDRVVSLYEDEGKSWSPAQALSWGNDYIGSTEKQVELTRKYSSLEAMPQVTVAVIDSGIDLDHELFDGRIVAGYDFIDDDAEPDDTYMHGSHVAGVIVNNTLDNVKIMPLRAGVGNILTESAIYASIEYAIAHGANVINMSLGTTYGSRENWTHDSIEQQAIRDAERAGIVLVGAHGNDSLDTANVFPSSDDAVISVSAIDNAGTLASFSNYGDPIDLCAPGVNIYSSVLDGNYENQSGTSMAAPFVSAASALLLSTNASMSSANVRSVLQSSADDLGPKGWDKWFGYGCVSLYKLVGANECVARIGSRGFAALSDAFNAASDGDEIVLLRDAEVSRTIGAYHDVTLTSERGTTVARAKGFEGSVFDVHARLTLGEESAPWHRLSVGAEEVDQNGDPLIKVRQEGALVVCEGTQLAQAGGTIVDADGQMTLDGCVVRAVDEGVARIRTSGELTLSGNLDVGVPVQMSDGSHINVERETIPVKGIALDVADLDDGYRVATFANAEDVDLALLYLRDSTRHLVAKDDSLVVDRMLVSAVRIGSDFYPSLEEALTVAGNGDTVTVCSDLSVSESIQVDKNVLIESEGQRTLVALPGQTGEVIRVCEGASVSIACADGSSLTMLDADGVRDQPYISVAIGARLELGQNVAIKGVDANSDTALAPIVNSGTLVVSGCRLTDNAGCQGGAIHNEGTLELTAGEVVGNSAVQGGGVYNAGSLVVSGCTIANNIATETGGGICNDGTCTLERGSVLNNSVTYRSGDMYSLVAYDDRLGAGGGVYNGFDASLTIGGSIIESNIGAYNGGGVCNHGSMRMTGGEIRSNFVGVHNGPKDEHTGSYSGSGSGVLNTGTLSFEGGSIVGNSGYTAYGIESNSSFQMSGGELSGNYAVYTGERTNELYVIAGEANLTGGTIRSDVKGESGIFVAWGVLNVGGSPSIVAPIQGSIHVVEKLTPPVPIQVHTAFCDEGAAVVFYEDGLEPNPEDFAPIGPTTSTVSADEEVFTVDGQSLVIHHGLPAPADGWIQLGSCEYQMAQDGNLIVRPRGTSGVFSCDEAPWKTGLAPSSVRFEEGVCVDVASRLFQGCASLERVDLSAWDPSTTTVRGYGGLLDLSSMFESCSSLKEVVWPAKGLFGVGTMQDMFSGCSSLPHIDLSCFDTSSTEDLSAMFSGCVALEEADMSMLDFSSAKKLDWMFGSCGLLDMVTLPETEMPALKSVSSMFEGCTALKAVNLAGINATGVTDVSHMFSGCQSLQELDLSSFDVSMVTTAEQMLYGCGSLRAVSMPRSGMPNLSEAEGMFSGCRSLTGLDVSGLDTTNVRDMRFMFEGCESLTGLNLSSFNTSRVSSMESMFAGCGSLTSLDLSSFDTSRVQDMAGMFASCRTLADFDISSFDVSHVRNTANMFFGCASLRHLDVSCWNTSLIECADSMFYDCTSLQSFKVGPNYKLVCDDMFPNHPSYGLWWSSVEGSGFSKEEIIATRLGVADTYLASTPRLDTDGWVDLADGSKGYAREGALVVGWMNLGSSKYYFHVDGRMATGWTDVEVDGKLLHYYFNPASGNMVRDTWFEVDGQKCYFRPSGNMATGWATINDAGVDKKYYFDEDGRLVTGWREIDTGQGYAARYYFRPSGAMATGFETIDGVTYYFRESGNLATGWATVSDAGVDKKYYFDAEGHMIVGWQDVDTGQGYVGRYYFRPSGAMATGWATIDGEKYWFRPSGNMATGFADVDDAFKRYFDAEGHMLIGWQVIGPNTYYFRSSGAMQTGSATIDGVDCTFTDKGVLVSSGSRSAQGEDAEGETPVAKPAETISSPDTTAMTAIGGTELGVG